MKKQTFIHGVAVLFFASILAKVLGAVYRIPLTWALGAQGLGMYQLIYPLFSLIVVVSSTAMPAAISKTIASFLKAGDKVAANKTFSISLKFLLVSGTFFALLLCVLSTPLALMQGNIDLRICYLGLAPAIILISILSSLRGYFQGYSFMTPTALSQILEQGTKLIIGLGLAYLLVPNGLIWGVFGAVVGVTISELISVLVLGAIYLLSRKNKYNSSQNGMRSTCITLTSRQISKEITRTACPIVVSNSILPLILFIESFLVIGLLQISGESLNSATSLWGLNSGIVGSLINMPIVLSQAVAITLVPFVAGAEREDTKERFVSSVGLGVTFALPVIVGFMLIGGDLISLIYGDSLSLMQIDLSRKLLLASCFVVLFGIILQIQNSLLYGLGKGKVSLKNMVIAGVIQIILFVVLTPLLSIWGCVISSIVFYLSASLLNYLYIRNKLALSLPLKTFTPAICGVILLGLFVTNVLLLNLTPLLTSIISILGGGLVYLFALWVFDGIDRLGLKNFKTEKV